MWYGQILVRTGSSLGLTPVVFYEQKAFGVFVMGSQPKNVCVANNLGRWRTVSPLEQTLAPLVPSMIRTRWTPVCNPCTREGKTEFLGQREPKFKTSLGYDERLTVCVCGI